MTVFLSHSIGSYGEFENRGQINVRSLETGSLSLQQTGTIDINELEVACFVILFGVGDSMDINRVFSLYIRKQQIEEIITDCKV